jgi:signal transduction histidine kinase
VDVGRTVEEVCRRYAPIAKDKGLALECGIESRDDLRVQVDPAELADCVANLVDNAIKYTPPPGRVTVRAARGLPARMLDARSRHGLPPGTAGEWVSIAVADTGMGLDPETLDALRNDSADGTIFDAYRRANNALEAGIPGTGLGLTIVREVAERCGGKIIVHSERGAGSTFTIALPVSPHDPTTSARLPPGSIVLVSGPDEDSGRSDACVAR